MAQEGMDPDQVINMSSQLKSQSDQINNVAAAINGLVGQLEATWKGQDATEFTNSWNTSFRPGLQNASEAI